MLRSRTSQIVLEFAFWVGSPPASNDGVYEMRTYLLKVNKYIFIYMLLSFL